MGGDIGTDTKEDPMTSPDPTQPIDPAQPIDPTQPVDLTPPTPPAPQTPPAYYAAPSTDQTATPSPPPPADPAWRPPRRHRSRGGSIIFGVILLVLGLWFFASQTLGIALPRLRWDEIWPILLIGIGAWVLVGSMGWRR
jgi:hypothetical protein